MASPSLIRQVVQAQKLHLVRQIAVLRQSPGGEHYATHEIAGSVTLTTKAEFGRKLNHTAGLGVFGPVSTQDLAAVADTYLATGLRPEFDICAAVPQSVPALLTAAGYQKTGTIDSFELSLHARGTDQTSPSLSSGEGRSGPEPRQEISVAETSDEDTFVQSSIAGFRSGGRSEELLELLARVAARRADTRLFLASMDGEVVGAAGLACIEVDGEEGEHVKVANFYIDSTIPEFRGMGVHAALLRARIRAAREMGCERVIASARAGSGSARNIERAGFAKVFENWVFAEVGEGKV